MNKSRVTVMNVTPLNDNIPFYGRTHRIEKMNQVNKKETPLEKQTNRKDFLSLVWQGTLGMISLSGIAVIVRFLSHTAAPADKTLFDLGPVDQLSTTSPTILQQAQAILIPTQEGFEALSLACPHLGCQVEIMDGGFECPCHGSQFNSDGSLIKGPANKSLRKLRLETSPDGHLRLDNANP